MNRTLIALGCAACAANATAATWTVDTNTGRPADFRSLQAAHDSASVHNGDVLHLIASPVSYGALNLTKPLTIIGPGYFLNQNLSFPVAAPSALTGTITFSPGSDGSLITGLEIAVVSCAGANNLTIKRNYIQQSISVPSGTSSSNVGIFQNYVTGDLNFKYIADGSNSGMTIRGNYVGGGVDFSKANDSGDFQFNIVHADCELAHFYVANNIIGGGLYVGPGSVVICNAWTSVNGPAPWPGTSPRWVLGTYHQWTSGADTFDAQFVSAVSTDARWKLKPDATVKGIGTNGVDPGMFSGPDPYIISGLPAVPMVIGIQAPTSASAASGLPVTVTLQVNP